MEIDRASKLFQKTFFCDKAILSRLYRKYSNTFLSHSVLAQAICEHICEKTDTQGRQLERVKIQTLQES